jgi:uncharacterized protein YodC (DUF2158 family)
MIHSLFILGDKVELKSGSQTMTVSEVHTTFDNPTNFTGYVSCKWFYEGKFYSETFHQDTLGKA